MLATKNDTAISFGGGKPNVFVEIERERAATPPFPQGDVLVEEKICNRFIVGGKCRPLEKCGGGGGGGDHWDDEVCYDEVCDDEVRVDPAVRRRATAGSRREPATPREGRRMSSVDMRRLQESRALYWKLNKDRRVMFVNRTDRLVYVFVFPVQERGREPTAVSAAVPPTPVGSVDEVDAATVQASREAHGGAFKPVTIKLGGVPAPSAAPSSNPSADLPASEVFTIWKNTGRRVRYMVATLEGDDVLVWKRAYAKGGEQVYVQPPIFSAGLLPVFREECSTADGDAGALSVVLSSSL